MYNYLSYWPELNIFLYSFYTRTDEINETFIWGKKSQSADLVGPLSVKFSKSCKQDTEFYSNLN